jgi:hypothetical protein
MWTLPSGVLTKFAFFEKFMPKIEPVLRQLFRALPRVPAKYFLARTSLGMGLLDGRLFFLLY